MEVLDKKICIVCNKRTEYWLKVNNNYFCSIECLNKYDKKEHGK